MDGTDALSERHLRWNSLSVCNEKASGRGTSVYGYRKHHHVLHEKGGDRQTLHEGIRELSVAVTKSIKLEGKPNDLLDRILADDRFDLTREELDEILDVKNFIGLAPQQTENFINEYINPVLEANKDFIGVKTSIRV